MKKIIAASAALFFLVASSGPLFAAEATPVTTPAAKTAKHAKHHWKKAAHGKKKAKVKAKASSTPTTTK